jgi:hypothetical protein
VGTGLFEEGGFWGEQRKERRDFGLRGFELERGGNSVISYRCRVANAVWVFTVKWKCLQLELEIIWEVGRKVS